MRSNPEVRAGLVVAGRARDQVRQLAPVNQDKNSRAQELMETLKTDVRQFILQTFVFDEEHDLADTDSFLEKGVVDSTGVLEIVSHLQEKYGVKVEDEEMLPDNLDSIDSIAAFVAKKQGNGS